MRIAAAAQEKIRKTLLIDDLAHHNADDPFLTWVCNAAANRNAFEDNVFEVSSRINSTFGGNITDFVRARLILEVIRRDDLVRNAEVVGAELMTGLEEFGNSHDMVSNVRGRGLFAASLCPALSSATSSTQPA